MTNDWRTFDERPERPMPVLYYHANWTWHYADDTPVPADPVRDPAERTQSGWFDGETWHDSGTGHDAFESPNAEDHPTHWAPLATPRRA